MVIVSVEQHCDCQANVAHMLLLLESIINPQLMLFGHWDSPPGLPAAVLSRVATAYRDRGWRVTHEGSPARVHICCTCEKKEGVCVTRTKY